MSKDRRTSVVICILLFFFIKPSCAQSHEIASTKRDSIVNTVGALIYATKYTEAHNEAVKNIYTYQNDHKTGFILYMMLSDIERLTGNIPNAWKYINKSEETLLRTGKKYSDLVMYTIYHSKANLYFETGKTDSAYVYASASILSCNAHLISMKNKVLTEQNLCRNLPIIGYYNYKKKNYEEAKNIYNQALELNMKFSPCESPLVYIKLADIYTELGNDEQSVVMAEKALAVADSCNNSQYKITALNKLLEIHKHLKKFEEVSLYQDMKMDLIEKENLYSQKNKLQELETKFRTVLKEEENRTLKIINQDQETQNRFQTYIIMLSGFILIIVLIFTVSFFYQKKRIAKQKEAVERLNLLNQKIFSVISHDFKGPMMGIDLLLDMNEKYGMDKQTFDHQTKQLRNDIKQANLIMENLMNWSKIELGVTVFEKNRSEVKAVSEEVIAQLRSLMDQKKIMIDNQIPVKSELGIPPDILKIIFRNLLSNAIKYSYEGGKIILNYNPSENDYSIRDFGIGMDAERQNLLFLNKLDSKLGTFHEVGYGIGLNIVYELIRKYGGTIWVTSILNEGTSIHFKFT